MRSCLKSFAPYFPLGALKGKELRLFRWNSEWLYLQLKKYSSFQDKLVMKRPAILEKSRHPLPNECLTGTNQVASYSGLHPMLNTSV